MSFIQKFLAIVDGKVQQLFAAVASGGTSSAGQIIAANAQGKLDPTFLPAGVGVNTVVVIASEALTAGRFVNLYEDSGSLRVRLASASSGRQAHGFVTESVALNGSAIVYPLDTNNAALSGLNSGREYWLGDAGAVTSTPLDSQDEANTGKVNQLLGVALSSTELRTDDYGTQVL